jgi:predicted RNase H-like HicB family nuclease
MDELMGNIKEAAALHLEEESYRDVKVHLVSEGTSAVRRFANGDLYD